MGHRDGEAIQVLIDVLIPTYGRRTGLAVVLTSLLGQTFTDFDVIISDSPGKETCKSWAGCALQNCLGWRCQRAL